MNRIAKPIPTTASVTTVAGLSRARVRHNGRVDLLGYASEADGGGQQLYYDAASTATIDGGFVFPGKGGSLSFDSSNVFNGSVGTGRYIAVFKNKADVRRFGAVGDGVADDSGPAQRALNSVVASDDSGVVRIPSGTFRVNMTMDVNNANFRIVGEGSKSVLISAADNDFAIRVTGQFPELMDIDSLKIIGDADGSQSKHGVYLNAGGGCNVINCLISKCGLGVVYNSTIGGVISQSFIERNYCGVYYTTRVSDLDVTDVAGQTVSLDAATFAQHSGFQHLDNVVWNLNKIGLYQDQIDNPFSLRSNIRIRNGLFQNGNIGLWIYQGGYVGDYPTVVDHTWFENFSTSTTLSFNGTSMDQCDIAVTSGRVVGESVRPIIMRTRGDSVVRLNEPVFNTAPTFDQTENSSIEIVKPFIDKLVLTKQAEEWSIYTGQNDRLAVLPISDRGIRVLNGKLRKRRTSAKTGNGAITVDFDADTHERKLVTLEANTTITLTATDPGEYWIGFLQDATGGWTVGYTTTVEDSGDLDTVASAANSYTVHKLYYDGTTWFGADYGDFSILESEDCRNQDPFDSYNQEAKALVGTDGPIGNAGCLEIQAQAGATFTGPRMYVTSGKPDWYVLYTMWLRSASPTTQTVAIVPGSGSQVTVGRKWQCYGVLYRRPSNIASSSFLYLRGQNLGKFRVAGIQVFEAKSMEVMRNFMRSGVVYYNEGT